MSLSVKNESRAIYFYSDVHEKSIYHIDKDDRLAGTMTVFDCKCSNWVLQLHKKLWLDNVKVLYQLAKIIETERPDNEINWEETFFLVEKYEYFKYLRELKDIPPGSLESIMLGHEESSEEVDEDIKRLVRQNLTDLRIAKK